jgi:hypothetical protein
MQIDNRRSISTCGLLTREDSQLGLQCSGSEWRDLRAAWQPMFFSGSLENYVPIFDRAATLMTEEMSLGCCRPSVAWHTLPHPGHEPQHHWPGCLWVGIPPFDAYMPSTLLYYLSISCISIISEVPHSPANQRIKSEMRCPRRSDD